MPVLATDDVRTMPKRKPKGEPRDRIDLRAEPEFVARMQAQADRLGLSLSAYIRLSVTERLERDEATSPRRRSGS